MPLPCIDACPLDPFGGDDEAGELGGLNRGDVHIRVQQVLPT